MNILVDTHILLWILDGGTKLSKNQKDLLLNVENTVFASQISLMEIAIKLKIGKLSDYELSCEQISEQWEINNFEWLKIKNKHLFAYNQVPFFEDHRDPFDRFLIATCQSESMYLLSLDGKFHRYKDLIQLL